jgi:hypothetical protein
VEPEFVDVGTPLSPAEAGTLEYELEKRGIAIRLRVCERGPLGDRQAVQVAPADLAAATALREELFPAGKAPEPPQAPRSKRLRNGIIAGVLGMVASMRVVRIVKVPKGPMTLLVVVGIALALFAAAFGVTRDPPGPGP